MLEGALRAGAVTELESGRTLSGDELRAEVERRARRLAARGVGRGARVLLLHGQTADFVADLLAVFRSGAAAAMADPGLSPPERANVARFLRPALALAAPGGPDAPGTPAAVLADDEGPGAEPAGGHPDDPALVLFTSGTTGEPKGVVHTHRSLAARVALNRAHVGDAVLARALCMLPTHFGHGLIGNLLTPLAAGGHVFLARFSGSLADELGAELAARRIRFFSSVPAMWRLLLERDAAAPAVPLQRVHVGSAPLSAELWRRAIAWSGTRRVVNTYGITETANWIGGASADEHEPRDGLIGRPWGGALAVRGADGALRACGEGELVVSTPSLMSGYLDRPDLTAAVVAGGWFRTGDLGAIDADGVARLVGRLKDEINRGGAKVQPEDVDLVIESHPDAAEACAFGVPDPVRGETVAAAVRPRPGAHLTAAELAAWCADRLRAHAVPETWFLVDEIPRTDRGKVNRARVREACLRRPGGERESA